MPRGVRFEQRKKGSTEQVLLGNVFFLDAKLNLPRNRQYHSNH